MSFSRLSRLPNTAYLLWWQRRWRAWLHCRRTRRELRKSYPTRLVHWPLCAQGLAEPCNSGRRLFHQGDWSMRSGTWWGNPESWSRHSRFYITCQCKVGGRFRNWRKWMGKALKHARHWIFNAHSIAGALLRYARSRLGASQRSVRVPCLVPTLKKGHDTCVTKAPKKVQRWWYRR